MIAEEQIVKIILKWHFSDLKLSSIVEQRVNRPPVIKKKKKKSFNKRKKKITKSVALDSPSLLPQNPHISEKNRKHSRSAPEMLDDDDMDGEINGGKTTAGAIRGGEASSSSPSRVGVTRGKGGVSGKKMMSSPDSTVLIDGYL